MLRCLCGPPSIPLSFSLARPYSPGGALNALASARRAGPPTPSAHRLRPGLPGYLILFAPPAFAPQRQPRPRGLPSPSAFFPISAHSTATPGIPSSPAALEPGSSGPVPGLSPGLRGLACRAACAPFTPNESGQRSPPTCYRGCWHVVSRGGLPPARGVAASGLRPLRKIPHCCLP